MSGEQGGADWQGVECQTAEAERTKAIKMALTCNIKTIKAVVTQDHQGGFDSHGSQGVKHCSVAECGASEERTCVRLLRHELRVRGGWAAGEAARVEGPGGPRLCRCLAPGRDKRSRNITPSCVAFSSFDRPSHPSLLSWNTPSHIAFTSSIRASASLHRCCISAASAGMSSEGGLGKPLQPYR